MRGRNSPAKTRAELEDSCQIEAMPKAMPKAKSKRPAKTSGKKLAAKAAARPAASRGDSSALLADPAVLTRIAEALERLAPPHP